MKDKPVLEKKNLDKGLKRSVGKPACCVSKGGGSSNTASLPDQIKISEEFGLNISKSTVHREIQRMKFSYITPRPIHHKQDKNKQEEFKKYFNKIVNSHPEKEVFF